MKGCLFLGALPLVLAHHHPSADVCESENSGILILYQLFFLLVLLFFRFLKRCVVGGTSTHNVMYLSVTDSTQVTANASFPFPGWLNVMNMKNRLCCVDTFESHSVKIFATKNRCLMTPCFFALAACQDGQICDQWLIIAFSSLFLPCSYNFLLDPKISI